MNAQLPPFMPRSEEASTRNTAPKFMTVLSIDAWGNSEDGYEWNEWWSMGRIPADTPNDQLIVAAHAAFIFTHPELPPELELVSDGYNMVVQNRETGKPLYAFEGAEE